MSNSVIVFGAAGGVGRSAALSASKGGAKVWLAMRDTNKPIPDLDTATEKSAGFERVQADLTNAQSIKDAVAKSAAKTAFVYVVFEDESRGKTAFEALKEAGITYIVLLSSVSVQPSAKKATEAGFIPKVHGEVELNLQDSGIQYATIRPAYFATNLFMYAEKIKNGKVRLFLPEALIDLITPEDIGAQAGALLVKPEFGDDEKNGKVVWQTGTLMSYRELFAIISKVFGQPVEVEAVDEETYRQDSEGVPKLIVDAMVDTNRSSLPGKSWYDNGIHEKGVANMKKYTGRDPTTLEDWLEANKAAFQ